MVVVTALQPISMNDKCRLAVIMEASPLFCKVGAPHVNPEGDTGGTLSLTPSLIPDPQDAVIVAITCQESPKPGYTVQGLCPGGSDDFLLLVNKIKDFLTQNLDKVTTE